MGARGSRGLGDGMLELGNRSTVCLASVGVFTCGVAVPWLSRRWEKARFCSGSSKSDLSQVPEQGDSVCELGLEKWR